MSLEEHGIGWLSKIRVAGYSGPNSLDNGRQLIRHRWRSNAIVRDLWKSRSVLHDSTLYVDKVFLASSGLFLEKTESTRLAYLYGENWITNTDTSTHYYEPQRGLLRLYPIPIINDELQLSVRRRCIDEFSWSDVSSEETPTITLDDIPYDLEEVLILAVCGIAYKKHDPDTLDIEMAREFSRMVDEMVGPPVSWKQKEARRINANMDTAIRGHSYFRSSVAQDLDWN
ncbi:MAG: hypothetical protein IPK83_23705 [Planctomycetes bacterium]|nr:hypothetical protein [Planctomycetota bacterium]